MSVCVRMCAWEGLHARVRTCVRVYVFVRVCICVCDGCYQTTTTTPIELTPTHLVDIGTGCEQALHYVEVALL